MSLSIVCDHIEPVMQTITRLESGIIVSVHKSIAIGRCYVLVPRSCLSVLQILVLVSMEGKEFHIVLGDRHFEATIRVELHLDIAELVGIGISNERSDKDTEEEQYTESFD